MFTGTKIPYISNVYHLECTYNQLTQINQNRLNASADKRKRSLKYQCNIASPEPLIEPLINSIQRRDISFVARCGSLCSETKRCRVIGSRLSLHFSQPLDPVLVSVTGRLSARNLFKSRFCR